MVAENQNKPRAVSDAQRRVYNAEKLGLVRGVLLRLRGQKSGIKLWDMRSIENWIRGEMEKLRPSNDRFERP